MRASFLALALPAFLPTGLASAAVINIDFNSAVSATYTGLAAAPDSAGDTSIWNPMQNNLGVASGSGLKDSTGAATSVGFTVAVTGGTISNANTWAERSGGYLTLMRDYVRLNSGASGTVGTATGSFSGLTVGNTYEIYFYGQGENFGHSATRLRGQNSLFTIDGESKQTSWDGVIGGDGALVEDIEYVKFTAVADSSGVIDFSWSNIIAAINGPDADAISNGSQFAALNAVQIVGVNFSPVPEPSACILGSLGAMALLRRRR